jgi:uncharacterized protein (DUF1800 family)
VLNSLPQDRWTAETAAHLLNRAGFGGTPDDIEVVYRKGLGVSVRDLLNVNGAALNFPPPEWAKPRNIRQVRMEARADEKGTAERQEKMRELRMMEGENIADLRRWWVDRMRNGPAPLLEKMTLFWHGHFATSIEKVKDAYWMWLQNDTFRRSAFGNFGALVKKISRDPAMMIYLDLQQSRQEHPNENWARELMELFTVGIGNYSEQDIRESARAFTGYRVDMTTQQFHFAPFQQDHANKTFIGRSGNLGGDDIIDTLMKQPACAKFIGRKLWRFFVEDDPSPEIVDAVAASIHAHNFEIGPVLRDIFTSSEFYSEGAMSSQIKSPVQFVVQTSKLLDAPLPAPVVLQNALRQMGQNLFAPPNVKGWDGGKSWITTATLLFRYNFANYLINGTSMLPANAPPRVAAQSMGVRRPGMYAEQMQRDPIDVSKLIPTDLREQPDKLVTLLASRLFPAPLPPKDTETFVQFVQTRRPDTSDTTMRELIHLMMSTPRFQLT